MRRKFLSLAAGALEGAASGQSMGAGSPGIPALHGPDDRGGHAHPLGVSTLAYKVVTNMTWCFGAATNGMTFMGEEIKPHLRLRTCPKTRNRTGHVQRCSTRHAGLGRQQRTRSSVFLHRFSISLQDLSSPTGKPAALIYLKIEDIPPRLNWRVYPAPHRIIETVGRTEQSPSDAALEGSSQSYSGVESIALTFRLHLLFWLSLRRNLLFALAFVLALALAFLVVIPSESAFRSCHTPSGTQHESIPFLSPVYELLCIEATSQWGEGGGGGVSPQAGRRAVLDGFSGTSYQVVVLKGHLSPAISSISNGALATGETFRA